MISRASHSVYQSATEIIDKNNKHLYPDMLDLLTKVTKTASPAINCVPSNADNNSLSSLTTAVTSGTTTTTTTPPPESSLNEDRLRFWYKNILPLLFDDNLDIQNKTVVAIQALLPHLETIDYTEHPDWPVTKQILSDQYTDNIKELLEQNKSNWYRIWTVLVRMLNKDILKSATLINKYLSLVEKAFRSSDMRTRSEAFICWKILVEIFYQNNELLSPKRIKLICIPLKSSQSKTSDIAVNKFLVWWYFMCKIHNNLNEYCETIVEPFLVFSFGPLGIFPILSNETVSTTPPSPGKTYKALMPMTIAALICLMGEPNDEIESICNRCNMERMVRPFESTRLFRKIGRFIINSCGEATVILSKLDTIKNIEATSICVRLWVNLLKNIDELRCIDLFNLVLDNIYALINLSTQNEQIRKWMSRIVYTISISDTYPLNSNTIEQVIDIDVLYNCIHRVVMLMFRPEIQYPIDYIDKIIEKLFHFDIYAQHQNYPDLLKKILKFLINGPSSLIKTPISNEIRYKMWISMNLPVCTYLTKLLMAFNSNEEATVIIERDELDIFYRYLNVPILLNCEEFTVYKERWCQLADAIIQVDNRHSFCANTVSTLKMIQSTLKLQNLIDIVTCLIGFQSTDFTSSDTMATGILEFIENTLITSTPTKLKDLNPIVNAINNYTKRLDGQQLIQIYWQLKNIIKKLENTVKDMRCDQSTINEFKPIIVQHIRTKRIIQQLLKSSTDLLLQKEFQELQKELNTFVVIPNVWKFNPDKLTDQQKDKMKERRDDIPALYNDMSQSQESHSILAWTPKKLIIPHSEDNISMEIEATTSVTVPSSASSSSTNVVVETVADTDQSAINKTGTTVPEVTAETIPSTEAVVDIRNINTASTSGGIIAVETLIPETIEILETPINELLNNSIPTKTTELTTTVAATGENTVTNLSTPTSVSKKKVTESELEEKRKQKINAELKRISMNIVDAKEFTETTNKLRRRKTMTPKANDAIQQRKASGQLTKKQQQEQQQQQKQQDGASSDETTTSVSSTSEQLKTKRKSVKNDDPKQPQEQSNTTIETIRQKRPRSCTKQLNENNLNDENIATESEPTTAADSNLLSKQMNKSKLSITELKDSSDNDHDEADDDDNNVESLKKRSKRTVSIEKNKEISENMIKRRASSRNNKNIKKIISPSVSPPPPPPAPSASPTTPLIRTEETLIVNSKTPTTPTTTTDITNNSTECIESSQQIKTNIIKRRLSSAVRSNSPTELPTISTTYKDIQTSDTLPMNSQCLNDLNELNDTNEHVPLDNSEQIQPISLDQLPDSSETLMINEHLNSMLNNSDEKNKEIAEMDTQPMTQTDLPIPTPTKTPTKLKITPEKFTIIQSPKKLSISPRPTSLSPPPPPRTQEDDDDEDDETDDGDDDGDNNIMDIDDDENVGNRTLLDQSIVCSPKQSDNDARNAELLNNTINISPILANTNRTNHETEQFIEGAKLTTIQPPMVVGSELAATTAAASTKPDDDDEEMISVLYINKEISTPSNQKLSENLQQLTPPMLVQPQQSQSTTNHHPPQKLLSRFQSSTPTSLPSIIPSCNNSPSSRFQFKGRGAQLLNMINNKNGGKSSPGPIISGSPILSLAPPQLPPPLPPTTNKDDFATPPRPQSKTSFYATTSTNITPLSTTEITPNIIINDNNQEHHQQQYYQRSQNRELLTFSKTLPSPMASPSCSILKRKYPADFVSGSGGGNEYDHVHKRKRVSFHDPPVSATKEYIGHVDEHVERNISTIKPIQSNRWSIVINNSNSGNGGGAGGGADGGVNSGGIITDNNTTADDVNNKQPRTTHENRIKQIFRRKSRADSMVEIAKLSNSSINNKTKSDNNQLFSISAPTSPLIMLPATPSTNSNGKSSTTMVVETTQTGTTTTTTTTAATTTTTTTSGISLSPNNKPNEMESLKWNEINQCDRNNVVEIDDDISITPSPSNISSSTTAAISLNHVLDEYSIDEYFEKYIESGRTVTLNSARIFTKTLSQIMQKNDKICSAILEILSENHSNEFLQHALQENLVSTVCDRLTPTVVLDYITEKAKTNYDLQLKIKKSADLLNVTTSKTATASTSPPPTSTSTSTLKSSPSSSSTSSSSSTNATEKLKLKLLLIKSLVDDACKNV